MQQEVDFRSFEINLSLDYLKKPKANNAEKDNLPDESCRRCGGLLLEYSQCSECKDPLQFICRICAHKTLERVHTRCFSFCEMEEIKPLIQQIQK